MKSFNKKLYSVIIVCMLWLCFTVGALATNSSDSTSSINNTTSTSTNVSQEGIDQSSSVGGENSGTSDSSAVTSGDLNGSDFSDSSDGSAEGESSDVSGSDLMSGSDISSGDGTSSNESESTNTSSSGTTTSKSPSYYGNIGGVVSDEADTSGWGGEDESSSLVSAGTTEKKDSKNITDYSSVLWILIWIPILLILGSVGALVYVNRKSFVEEDLSFTDEAKPQKRKLSEAEKAKRRNNHKNRTNVYRPRD